MENWYRGTSKEYTNQPVGHMSHVMDRLWNMMESSRRSERMSYSSTKGGLRHMLHKSRLMHYMCPRSTSSRNTMKLMFGNPRHPTPLGWGGVASVPIVLVPWNVGCTVARARERPRVYHGPEKRMRPQEKMEDHTTIVVFDECPTLTSWQGVPSWT